MPKNPCRRPLSIAALCLVLTVALALVPTWSWAVGTCSIFSTPDSTMPRTAPQSLWGELKPAGVILDTTGYTGNQRADSRYPQPTSIDIENGYLFASYWAGVIIYDLRSNPAAPVKLSTIDGWSGGAFPQWILGQSETDQFIYAVDAPEGDDSIIALGGISPMGLSIWDTSNKSAPTALYQDANGKEIAGVWTATINQREYAFAGGAFSGGEYGLFVYDMTAARSFHGCLEDVSHGVRNCPGVYITKISTGGGAVQYVHGMKFGSKTYVVTSPGQSSVHGVQIWDVSNPAAPVRVTTGFTGSGLANFTAGVALWQQNNSAYLAVRQEGALQVFDVTSCLTSGCASLPGPITNYAVAPVSESDYWKTVNYSKSGSTPILFLGNQLLCHAGQPPGHIEYLLDMTTPTAPRDMTPSGTTNFMGETVDYWSYYYNDDIKGLAFSASRGGKMYAAPNGNSYFYRTDLTLFDVHQWTGGSSVAPTANFTWSPATAYAGDPVAFSDTSAGLVSSRTWSFPGGAPSTGTTTPINVTFATPGTKNVSLTVSNTAGSNNISQNVTVLDPSPAVSGVSNPASAPVCGVVSWSAVGATGRSPLTIAWTIKNSANQTVASGNGNPFNWDTTGQATDTYTGTVTVSNGAGAPATASGTVTLNPLATLPGNGQFAPTSGPTTTGVVTFNVNVAGATEWCWDFGDGQSFPAGCLTGGAWSKDLTAGPNPTHSFATGTFNVKVSVRNCQNTAGVTSAPLAISVINPLVANFAATCNVFGCNNTFTVGDTINFVDASTGNPDGYYYNWNYNGSDENACAAGATGDGHQQPTHVYTTAGTFRPCLKITRGTASDVALNPAALTIQNGGGGGGGGGGSATIVIGGASSGTINNGLSFSASATNCTPAATWTWNAGGGTISGSSTGSQVTISWPSTGTKTVTATNSGCSGATGVKSVSITDSTTNGLASSFTFNPAAPTAGQAVSFDGSSSTGTPTAYSWDFGDGQTATNSTPTSSHTYAAAGTFTVTLSVAKPGGSCPFGVCSATSSKTVTVLPGGPPPLVATFDTGAPCTNDFAGFRCTANTGDVVTFTATTANATSYSWSFGDGATASGVNVTHTWTAHNTYTVVLTVSDGRSTASTSRTFIISGDDIGGKKAVILPWVAQTRGALVQTTDLYLLNPTTAPMNVTLSFIRRGNTPETNPPKASRTIQPGTTLYVADVLGTLFNRQDVAGFVTATVDQGSTEPVLTAFNTTVQSGKSFSQTLSGQSWSSTANATSNPGTVQVQNLIGLADNSSLLASVGLSNPGSAAATYTMRLFDKLGKQIGTSKDFVVAQFGQRQYQPKDIQALFGLTNQDDYRVEIRNTGAQIFPYAANLRGGSNDPSFVGAGAAAPDKVYLIGALSAPDASKHLWKSDVVLSNVASEVVLTDVSFIGPGVTAKPTAPVHVTLQPGSTERMTDVIGSQWGLHSTVGVITLDSNAPGGVFPLVQGESYDSSIPAKRFGQLMPAMTESQAAGTNASHYLVGLRQDAKNRTTYWVFNPGTVPCVYDLVYLGLDGHELGRISGVAMNPGIVRQFGPTQHKLPVGGVTDGFTVQVQVKSGKVLAAAQVVNAASNDSAYIVGVTR